MLLVFAKLVARTSYENRYAIKSSLISRRLQWKDLKSLIPRSPLQKRCIMIGNNYEGQGSALDTGQMELCGSKGQVSTISKPFPKVVTRSYYQTQKLSMTENDFLFLILQKKQFLEKRPFLQAR